MKKSILNIGKALNKAEQKQISGGSLSLALCKGLGRNGQMCNTSADCIVSKIWASPVCDASGCCNYVI